MPFRNDPQHPLSAATVHIPEVILEHSGRHPAIAGAYPAPAVSPWVDKVPSHLFSQTSLKKLKGLVLDNDAPPMARTLSKGLKTFERSGLSPLALALTWRVAKAVTAAGGPERVRAEGIEIEIKEPIWLSDDESVYGECTVKTLEELGRVAGKVAGIDPDAVRVKVEVTRTPFPASIEKYREHAAQYREDPGPVFGFLDPFGFSTKRGKGNSFVNPTSYDRFLRALVADRTDELAACLLFAGRANAGPEALAESVYKAGLEAGFDAMVAFGYGLFVLTCAVRSGRHDAERFLADLAERVTGEWDWWTDEIYEVKPLRVFQFHADPSAR